MKFYAYSANQGDLLRRGRSYCCKLGNSLKYRVAVGHRTISNGQSAWRWKRTMCRQTLGIPLGWPRIRQWPNGPTNLGMVRLDGNDSSLLESDRTLLFHIPSDSPHQQLSFAQSQPLAIKLWPNKWKFSNSRLSLGFLALTLWPMLVNNFELIR